MSQIIPFPSPPEKPAPRGRRDDSARRAIPYSLVEAATNILNEVVKQRRGQVLSDEDWARVRRACNFIDGAKVIAREHGLPFGEKRR